MIRVINYEILNYITYFFVLCSFYFYGLICKQEYSALFEGAGNNPGDKTLEDKFFEHEASRFVLIFQNNNLLDVRVIYI